MRPEKLFYVTLYLKLLYGLWFINLIFSLSVQGLQA